MGPAYNQPFKITFTGGGRYLLCGYVQGDFSTFASGQLQGTVATAVPVTPPPATPAPPVIAPAPAPPVAPAAPVAGRRPWITRRGHALTCHPGTWSNAPVHIGYRWYAKGKAVGSGSRLTVRRSLEGRMVACRVTAGNAAGRKTTTTRAVPRALSRTAGTMEPMDPGELRAWCLQQPGATEDFPFAPGLSVFKVAGKVFALSHLAREPLEVSLKCEPELAVSFRATYPAVRPGYHLNKRHWNTLTLDGTLPDQLVRDMVEDSYDLVVSALPRRVREQLR